MKPIDLLTAALLAGAAIAPVRADELPVPPGALTDAQAMSSATLSTEGAGLSGPVSAGPPVAAPTPQEPATARTGQDVYRSFREGLAEPVVCNDENPRWQRHFATAPQRLARSGEGVLPLFSHVVDQLRAAKLPTEYALIPFVESGYRPQARSGSGPAGLWQLVASTARHFKLAVGKGQDARLSPTESTRAAVDYLSMLHRTFGGNWRLAVMAYNAGENRVLKVLKRQGRTAKDGDSAQLADLPAVTRAYVDKLEALSCVMHRADEQAEFQQALDRPVPAVPGGTVAR